MAICIKCGSIKKKPEDVCPVCGFRPGTDEEKAKSIILSTDYEIEGEYRGRSREDLLGIGSLVKAGQFRFDPDEVTNVTAYAHGVSATPPSRLALDLLKWVGPTILILVAVYVLLWLSR